MNLHLPYELRVMDAKVLDLRITYDEEDKKDLCEECTQSQKKRGLK